MSRRKKKSEEQARARILDAWQPPRGAGGALGCLATTFTFDAAFFEEHCVGRFLEIETSPEESGAAYLIERAERLRQAYVGVIVDRAHAAEERSLSWDVLPVGVSGGCMHAKVALLAFANQIRVIVGSANLTEPGYRSNLETFCVLDFKDGDGDPQELLTDVIEFLSSLTKMCRDKSARDRAMAFLSSVRQQARKMEPPKRKLGQLEMKLVVNGAFEGKKTSALRSLREDAWKAQGPPRACTVVSPFFDKDPTAAVEALRGILAQRGDTTLEFVLACRQDESGKITAQAPPLLPKGAHDAELFRAHLEDENEVRHLHAKALWLESDRSCAMMIGSSNFTCAGLGIGDGPYNVEANVAFVAGAPGSDTAMVIGEAFPRWDEELDPEKTEFVPAFDPAVTHTIERDALSVAFYSATFESDGAVQRVRLVLDPVAVPERWRVSAAASGETTLIDADAWRAAGANAEIEIPWSDVKPPSVLYVFWHGADGTERSAAIAVNVIDFAILPLPEEMRDLSLDALLDVLTMSKPMHEVIERVLRKQKAEKERQQQAQLSELDPHKRVDTGAFLLARTKRFTHAIEGLRTRLESPVYSDSMLHWRVHGPLGPVALQRAVESDGVSDGEKCFLLSEIALLLSRVVPKKAPGTLAPHVVRRELRGVAETIKSAVAPKIDALPEDLASYLEHAFAEACGEEKAR